MSGATAAKSQVLFVDDEQRVLNSMRVMFRRDYQLHLTTSGPEALDIIARHPIDVIVADMRMPEMTGVEVLSAVKNRSPKTVRILLTGYADLDAIEGSINEGEVFRFLTKPCAPEELRQTIREAATIARDDGLSEALARLEMIEAGESPEAMELVSQAVEYSERSEPPEHGGPVEHASPAQQAKPEAGPSAQDGAAPADAPTADPPAPIELSEEEQLLAAFDLLPAPAAASASARQDAPEIEDLLELEDIFPSLDIASQSRTDRESQIPTLNDRAPPARAAIDRGKPAERPATPRSGSTPSSSKKVGSPVRWDALEPRSDPPRPQAAPGRRVEPKSPESSTPPAKRPPGAQPLQTGPERLAAKVPIAVKPAEQDLLPRSAKPPLGMQTVRKEPRPSAAKVPVALKPAEQDLPQRSAKPPLGMQTVRKEPRPSAANVPVGTKPGENDPRPPSAKGPLEKYLQQRAAKSPGRPLDEDPRRLSAKAPMGAKPVEKTPRPLSAKAPTGVEPVESEDPKEPPSRKSSVARRLGSELFDAELRPDPAPKKPAEAIAAERKPPDTTVPKQTVPGSSKETPPAEPAGGSPDFPDFFEEDDESTQTIILEGDSVKVIQRTIDASEEAGETATDRSPRREDVGVVVFSADTGLLSTVREALSDRHHVVHASNIIEVIELLETHKPGVLITDISDDAKVIEKMTANLKAHLPELVTLVVGEHRDTVELVNLINHGQIFRFLRKPLSVDLCLRSVQAATAKHLLFRRYPDLLKRYSVKSPGQEERSRFAETFGSLVDRLRNVRRKWNTSETAP